MSISAMDRYLDKVRAGGGGEGGGASYTSLHNVTTLLKGLQLSLALIVLLMGRFGTAAAAYDDGGYVPYGNVLNINHLIVGNVVAYGFFYIILAQVLSIAKGETPFALHMIFDVVGGVLYIVIGSLHLSYWVAGRFYYGSGVDVRPSNAPMLAAGSATVITGVLLLLGAVVWGMRCKAKLVQDITEKVKSQLT